MQRETEEKHYRPAELSRTAADERRAVLHSVERLHAAALEGGSFEDASVALESVDALQNFRRKARRLPFSGFHEMVEAVTNLGKRALSKEERTGQTETLIAALEQNATRFSPRVADLYFAILAAVKNEPYEPHFEVTRKKISELQQNGDVDVLFSRSASWNMKFNRIETRLTDYLLGVRAFDRREGDEMDDDMRTWREEELKKAPTNPPERKNESKPGVDPMERLKEGERAPAIWSMYPAWGGYYREQSFSRWVNGRNVWVEEEYAYRDAETMPSSGNKDYKKGPVDIALNAKTRAGSWIPLPIPYTHGLHAVEAEGRTYSVQRDQNGDQVLFVDGSGEVEVRIILAPHPEKKFTSDPATVRVPEMAAEFSEETNNTLGEIKKRERGNSARARAICSYVRSRIRYLAPKDRAESERYNAAYAAHPKGFAGAVDELKAADCDVANTYFAALCATLNIPVRHVIGHSVKGKDKKSAASIHSGTGHGWSEVWDEVRKEWVRMDATPTGDPNLEEDEQDGESAPGDYGEQEAVRPSDEQLEELRKKLAERKEQLSYTKEERQLAEGADIALQEARKIVNAINEAERTRLPNGELIADVLAKLFNAIVESRKSAAAVYAGPVRKKEGGESIQDIVRHKIGITAGETDPLSREKPEEETNEEKLFGGFDVYNIADKSGSMGEVTSEGEALWVLQRRAKYLIFSALHRFERNAARAGLQDDNALSVRTQCVSFRGNGPDEIDVDKPLSSQFTAQDKVNLWHSLGGARGGNGDPEALGVVYEQIKKEIDDVKRRGGEDNRLRIVIAFSDGGYIGDDDVKMRTMAEELGRLNAVVVGIGLTEAAENVPVVMHNPPYSRGEIIRNLNDLPAVEAKYIVDEAIRLFPEKARENATRITESSLAKFRNM